MATSNSIRVFADNSAGAVFHKLDTTSDKAYFTLAATAGDKLKTVLMGSAPALSVKVTEAVDFDMHKALNGGFLVASFGYAPIQIEIQGIDIWNPSRTCNADLKGDIKSWWDTYNLHAAPNERIKLSLTRSGSNTSYACITTNLVRSVKASEATIGEYALSIIGVRL